MNSQDILGAHQNKSIIAANQLLATVIFYCQVKGLQGRTHGTVKNQHSFFERVQVGIFLVVLCSFHASSQM